MDLLTRSMPGVFIYAIVFPILFFPLGFYRLEPELSWVFAFGMLFISSLRLVHRVYTGFLYKKNPKLWLLIFQSLSMLHAIQLGIFFAMTVSDPQLAEIQTISYMTIGGVCGAALISLTPRIGFALINLGCLILPSIFAAIIIIENYPIAFMMSVYSLYVIAIGIRTNKEYIRSFTIEAQLEKQRQELEQLNKIDPLTHIYNRGYFNTAFDIQWFNSIRQKTPLALLLIDIDHFKSINDTHGHLYGDKCLIHIAQIISEAAKRKTDLIARFGGEEFAILLPNTNEESARELAEQLRISISISPFSYENSELFITSSIGVACVTPQLGIKANSLIAKADSALYEAKDQGRNRVCTFSPNTGQQLLL